MSLLVRYTLKSKDHRKTQNDAMIAMVDGLRAEGIAGFHYSCFSTGDPLQFLGIMEFPDDETKQQFLTSGTFESYRAALGPILEGPPETSEITSIATTRD